jgi:hypothetical protein
MKSLSTVTDLIKQFYPFAKDRFGFRKPVRLFLRQDLGNSANPLGKTAYYDPQKMSITIYITNRHPKDILRSFSHELVHHKQNCEGGFDHTKGDMGEGYAQKNGHLRKLEEQAYLEGNMCVRDFSDGITQEE